MRKRLTLVGSVVLLLPALALAGIPQTQPVPVLSDAGLLGLGAALVVCGAIYVVRRKR